MRRYLLCASCLLLIICCLPAKASHLYGADFFYEHIKDTSYKVTLVAYGDCSGAAFSNGFYGATPIIKLIRSGRVVDSFRLTLDTAGEEVTPVCKAEKANTACANPNSFTVPGIMRFRYSAKIYLPSPYRSTSWLFRFEGNMGRTISGAGRSNSITSINIPGSGSLMTLEAALNNSTSSNSSPQFKVIPTPFFCANIPQQYNQGAVDPDGDVLTYALTDGLEPAPTYTVTYNSGYSASSPVKTAAGNFSFNTSNGQMSFTPSIAQRSLVVNKVEEYRNGILVGTSMREMTFVVLANCNNTPAYSAIDSVNNAIGGLPSDPTTFNVCQGTDSILFHILPINPGNDTIYATVQGLPGGAAATIVGDSTPSPDIIINWKTPTLAAGSYNFFVTYKDNGCPLSSTQTQAYTVRVIRPNEMQTVVAAPTQCVHQALVNFGFQYGLTPRTVTITQGGNLIHSYTDTTGAVTDSLPVGLYNVSITSPKLACPTIYQLRIADSGIYPRPPVTTPKFYCFGDPAQPVTAIADSGALLNWYNAAGILLPGAPTPRTDTVGIFIYYTSQVYKVCTSLRDSLPVYVTKRPVASIDGPDMLCNKDTATFVFNGSVGVGPILEYNWYWNEASYAPGKDGGPYRVHWNVPGLKTITLVVSENKCVSQITKKDVDVKPTPYAGFNYPATGICQYETALLAYNTRPYPGQHYTWSFAGAVTVDDKAAPEQYLLRWDTAGTKRLWLAVDLNGCIDTQYAEVRVNPAPLTRITNVAGPVCIGDKIFVTAVADDATFSWQPARNLLRATDGRPYFQILEPSVYKVYATSSFGCIDSAQISYDVVQPCCEFSYPDAFTPNNDGHNDRFRIVTYGNQLQYELSIYNRWGQRVYYGHDAKSGWDGTMNNDGGTRCDAGTYFYFLRAKCFTGHEEAHKGEVVLIR